MTAKASIVINEHKEWSNKTNDKWFQSKTDREKMRESQCLYLPNTK